MSRKLPTSLQAVHISLNRSVLAVLVIAATLGLTACSVFKRETSVLRQHFDENTGANITSLTQPLIFYSEKPWLAANARDYIYLGPIEVIRTGQRDYLLWLGIWSTIDRLGRPAESIFDNFQTVYLVTDGEPMALEITAWSGKELGMEDSVYSTPVDSAVNAFYAVSKDQVQRLAQADRVQIHLHTEASPGSGYLPGRRNSQSITEFANYLSDQ